jgi:hypothetical protein
MATKVIRPHFLGLFIRGLRERCSVSPVPNSIEVPEIQFTRAIQQVDEGILNRIGIKLG